MLQHHEIVGRDVEIGIVDARRQILERGEHDRAPLLLEQFRIGGRALEDRALRRQRAEQRDEPALRLQRLGQRADDLAIHRPGRSGEALPDGLAGDGQAIEVEEGLQLAQHRANTAGCKQIFHVMRPGRL